MDYLDMEIITVIIIIISHCSEAKGVLRSDLDEVTHY